MPQHLACIETLARISGAETAGAAVGSTEITFRPGQTMAGEYFFDIGTAGSTSLLLQALLPPLLFSAKNRSAVTLVGGTHVPFSPPFDYIREIFMPALQALGANVRVSIERYGFYPRGGGKITAGISPAKDLRPARLEERGHLRKISVTSVVGRLPLGVAKRQCNAAVSLLEKNCFQAECREISVPAYGKGTYVFLRSESEHAAAGFSSLGAIGKKAEEAGEEAAREFLAYASTGACIDHHLADQLILFLASARGESAFTTSLITDHLLTNLRITELFTGMEYEVRGRRGMPGRVSITGKGPIFQLDSPKTDQ